MFCKMFAVLSCLLLTLTHYTQGKCECDVPTTFYEDIGCKPIFKDPGDCCPQKYDCSNLEKAPKDGCSYKGKFYKIRETIPNTETYANCNVECMCQKQDHFVCAILDCPEWLHLRPDPGCHFKYELDKCCQVGQVCEPYDESIKCEVNGTVYREGQKFSPPTPDCLSCVCQKGFKGEYVEPFCKNLGCSSEIRNSEKMRKNCAAVFIKSSKCCPFEFLCPSDTDKIELGPTSRHNPDLKCKYGEKLLNIGDKFKQEKTECECKYPPFMTCEKTF